MSCVGDLFVKIHDDPSVFASLDQLCPGCSSYPVPLENHSKSFESLSSLAHQSGGAIIVRLTMDLDLACEEFQQCLLDLPRILGGSDRSLCND